MLFELLAMVLGVMLVCVYVVAPIVLLVRQQRNHQQTSGHLARLSSQISRQGRILQELVSEQVIPDDLRAGTPAPGAAEKTQFEAPQRQDPEPAFEGTRVEERPGPIAPSTTPPAVPTSADKYREPAAPADARGVPVFSPTPPQPEFQPLPPAKPREPNRFEVAAREVLGRVWNWIVVGDERRPDGVSLEYAIATNWLLRVGVLILVVGIGFFLKYSVEHGWIGPIGRVSLAVVTGLVMLVTGIRLLAGSYRLLGQGLMGAGVATLYFAVFAAANFYALIGFEIAFVLMGLVTVSAGVIAVRFDSVLVAVLGILGGYGTPLMLPITDDATYLRLFGYLLILGTGVFGISYRKNWQLLNLLSFICTYGLYLRAMQDYQMDHFWQVMPFLTAFFILFSTMIFIFNLVNGEKSTLLHLLALLTNAGIFFVNSYELIDERYGKEWVASVTLGLSAFYIGHVWFFLRRKLLDRELLLCFTGLAAFFLAVTIPLVLSDQWITATWAIQALVMLWIAGRLESQFLRHVAFLLYAIVMGRFLIVDLRSQYALEPVAQVTGMAYLGGLLERLVVLGVPIASMGAAGYLLRSPVQPAGTTIGRANDIVQLIRDRTAIRAAVFAAVSMMFLYLHLELNRSVGYFFEPARLPVLTFLWLGLCGFLLHEYLASPSKVLLGVLGACAAGLLFKFIFFDLAAWDLAFGLVYRGSNYEFLEAGMRLLDFGAIIAFCAVASRLLPDQPDQQQTVTASMLSAAIAFTFLFMFLTLEVNTFLLHFQPGLRSGGISILWSLFALGLVLGGILKGLTAPRMIGLGLFGVVAVKVFFVDLSRLSQLHRISAFILLGVLLLVGSFVYLRYRSTFTVSSPPDDELNQ